MFEEKSSDQLAFEKAQRRKKAGYWLLIFNLLLLLLMLNNLNHLAQTIHSASIFLLMQCALLTALLSWAISRHYYSYIDHEKIFGASNVRRAIKAHIVFLQLKKTLHRKSSSSNKNIK